MIELSSSSNIYSVIREFRLIFKYLSFSYGLENTLLISLSTANTSTGFIDDQFDSLSFSIYSNGLKLTYLVLLNSVSKYYSELRALIDSSDSAFYSWLIIVLSKEILLTSPKKFCDLSS